MNSKFLEYRPANGRMFQKGQILEPIFDGQTSIEELQMEEHKTNVYGEIIVGIILLGFVLLLLTTEVTTNLSDIGFYCFVGALSLISLILLIKGIEKLFGHQNKSRLSINQQRLRYFDSIKSKSYRIEWKDIKDIKIKYYHNQHGYSTYILIQKMNTQIDALEITYLYLKGTKSIMINDIKKSMKVNTPRYLELRKIIGKYLKANRDPKTL